MQWAREKECSSRDENTSKSSQSRWVYQAGVRNGVKEKEAKKKGSIRWSDSAKKRVKNKSWKFSNAASRRRKVISSRGYARAPPLCLSGGEMAVWNKSEREKEWELAERPKHSGPERREMAE